jgi:hypothetical protein
MILEFLPGRSDRMMRFIYKQVWAVMSESSLHCFAALSGYRACRHYDLDPRKEIVYLIHPRRYVFKSANDRSYYARMQNFGFVGFQNAERYELVCYLRA